MLDLEIRCKRGGEELGSISIVDAFGAVPGELFIVAKTSIKCLQRSSLRNTRDPYILA